MCWQDDCGLQSLSLLLHFVACIIAINSAEHRNKVAASTGASDVAGALRKRDQPMIMLASLDDTEGVIKAVAWHE
jgi:hypothetical protein